MIANLIGESNSKLVDRFFDEILNGKNPNGITTLVTPEFVTHHPALPGGKGGASDVVALMAAFRVGFPDLSYAIDDRVTNGDKATARWLATGTHNGTFMGIAATGKQVVVAGTDLFRIRKDRLAETWVCSDLFGLFRQLGKYPVIP